METPIITEENPKVNQILKQYFDNLLSQKDENHQLAEKIINAILSYGKVETTCAQSKVLMIDDVLISIQKREPIKFLITISSSKLPEIGKDIDVCELLFLLSLKGLQNLVQNLYQPGCLFVVRVEDLKMIKVLKISEKIAPFIEDSCKKYSNQLIQLAKDLKITQYTKILKESELMNPSEYEKQVDLLVPIFDKYLKDSAQKAELNSLDFVCLPTELTEKGWSGHVSKNMRQFLEDQYSKFYEKKQIPQVINTYLAGSLTRKILNGNGLDTTENYLEITFCKDPPDFPKISKRFKVNPFPGATFMPFWKTSLTLEVHPSTKKVKIITESSLLQKNENVKKCITVGNTQLEYLTSIKT